MVLGDDRSLWKILLQNKAESLVEKPCNGKLYRELSTHYSSATRKHMKLDWKSINFKVKKYNVFTYLKNRLLYTEKRLQSSIRSEVNRLKAKDL